MSEAYLAHPDSGEPIATDDSVLQTLWEQGLLSEDLLYWRSDLSGWVRLGERFEDRKAPAAAPAPLLPERSLRPEPEARSVRRRTGGRPAAYRPRHPRRRPFRDDLFEIDFDF